MGEIMYLSRKYKLAIVEDACQSHGAAVFDRRVGSIGDLGCFSFYATKNMTTGEGGMITTSRRRLSDKLRLLRNHGMSKQYKYELLGYNLRMTDIQAAMGIEQLKKLDKFNQIRMDNGYYLNRVLLKKNEINLPGPHPFDTHVFNQYTISVPSDIRDKLIKKFDNAGFQTRVYYPESLTDCPSAPEAWKASKRVLSLPIHPGVKKSDLDRMAGILASL